MARTTHETRFNLTAKDKTKAVFGTVKKGLGSLRKSVTGLHTGFLALAGIAGAGLLTKSLIDVNAEFQTIKASLKTMTGGTKEAAAAFEMIEKFAVETPFALKEVVQSFIKLKALGLDPSAAALRSYGNTASALGKSLDQMIEAVADAATGEFERLKEFGIKAKKWKGDVTFTFQGVSTVMANTAENVQAYLRQIGDVQFSTAMSDQMKNMTPAFSNFGAAVDKLSIAIGEAGLNDAIAGVTNEITGMINSMDAALIGDFTREAIAHLKDFLSWWDRTTGGIAEFLARDTLNNLPGAGGIPAGPVSYRLGDFNNQNQPAGGGIFARARANNQSLSEAGAFQEFANKYTRLQAAQNPDAFKGLTESAGGQKVFDQTFREAQTQTRLLERVIDVLEKSSTGAVAQ
jgi:hypothetical protein